MITEWLLDFLFGPAQALLNAIPDSTLPLPSLAGFVGLYAYMDRWVPIHEAMLVASAYLLLMPFFIAYRMWDWIWVRLPFI